MTSYLLMKYAAKIGGQLGRRAALKTGYRAIGALGPQKAAGWSVAKVGHQAGRVGGAVAAGTAVTVIRSYQSKGGA